MNHYWGQDSVSMMKKFRIFKLFPQYNVDISIKRSIHMLSDIQVEKITEVMVHVYNCNKKNLLNNN